MQRRTESDKWGCHPEVPGNLSGQFRWSGGKKWQTAGRGADKVGTMTTDSPFKTPGCRGRRVAGGSLRREKV